MAFIIETISLVEIKDKFRFFIYVLFRSSIFKAIESDSDDKVIKLATKKRLKSAKGFYGESPLVACIRKRKSVLACTLIDLGGSFDRDGTLIAASMAGDQLVVDHLLQKGADPNDTSGNSEYHEGHTPLMWATSRHFFGIIKSLLDAGANINAISKDNTVAVMYTRKADENDLIVLRMLLEYRPDILVRDWRGRNLVQEAEDRARYSAKPEMLNLLKIYYPELKLGEAQQNGRSD